MKTTVIRLLRAAQAAGILLLLVTSFGPQEGLEDTAAGTWVLRIALAAWATAMAEFVIRTGLAVVRSARRKDGPPPDGVVVDVPVTGRWKAVNSPADKVPSHCTHFLAQTYAIDLVRAPDKGSSPVLRWWPPFPRNEDFPAYGSAILAPADGTVVTAVDTQRDHRARNTIAGLLYFFVVEQLMRSVGSIGQIVGNHVVLELADGTYALFAHLRRGSLAVREGETVRAGQRLADCGNTGNSTEPHLHFQLMDGPDPVHAKGVPFDWRGVGVPKGGVFFTATFTTAAAKDQFVS